MSSQCFAEIDAAHADKLDSMTMHERAVAGLPYMANDADLARKRIAVRRLYRKYNLSEPREVDPSDDSPESERSVTSDTRRELLTQILHITPEIAQKVDIEPPFYCDYGYNIKVQGAFYCGWNTVILDCAEITIEDGVLFGPNVQVYSATHSVSVTEREEGWERALPIKFGRDCWIGGSAIILAGVTIGEGATVGAGSVVSKDVPPFSIAVGNPARVVRTLKPEERGKRWAQGAAATEALQAQA